MCASISSTTVFMAESLANRLRRCDRCFVYISGGTARGALAGRLLDRRQRRRPRRRGVREVPLHLAKVAKQGGLANIVYGQHPYQVTVLYDGQCPEAALLQDTVALCEEVGVGRKCGELRLHKVADGGVAIGGMGCGHDLIARDNADQMSFLVEDREVLLVAVDNGVQDLAEVVVGRYDLGSALGTHYVCDSEPAQLLPLAHQLGLAARAEEDEEADNGEQEVVAKEAEEDEEDGEGLPYGRGDISGAQGPEARGEQAAQHTAAIHREGRYHVEDHEGDVDHAQGGEDLTQGPYP